MSIELHAVLGTAFLNFIVLTASLLPMPIETHIAHTYSDAVVINNKSILAIPKVREYGEIFHILPRYHPSLRSGRYG